MGCRIDRIDEIKKLLEYTGFECIHRERYLIPILYCKYLVESLKNDYIELEIDWCEVYKEGNKIERTNVKGRFTRHEFSYEFWGYYTFLHFLTKIMEGVPLEELARMDEMVKDTYPRLREDWNWFLFMEPVIRESSKYTNKFVAIKNLSIIGSNEDKTKLKKEMNDIHGENNYLIKYVKDYPCRSSFVLKIADNPIEKEMIRFEI